MWGPGTMFCLKQQMPKITQAVVRVRVKSKEAVWVTLTYLHIAESDEVQSSES